MATGLFARFNYTLSECITDSDDDLPASELNGGGAAWTPTYNHAANRHRCSFQGRNSVNLSLSYDFPFGKNATSKLAKVLLPGWQLTTLTAISSGLFRLTFVEGVNLSRALNSGTGNSHPDVAPGCNAQNMINSGNPTNFVNIGCLLPGVPGYLGDMGPLALTGPGLWDTDMSLKKNITLHEAKTLQLSADMFNAFNRANFSVPSSTTAFNNIGSAAAPVFQNNGAIGQITSTVTTSRQLQIGAKFIF